MWDEDVCTPFSPGPYFHKAHHGFSRSFYLRMTLWVLSKFNDYLFYVDVGFVERLELRVAVVLRPEC